MTEFYFSASLDFSLCADTKHASGERVARKNNKEGSIDAPNRCKG